MIVPKYWAEATKRERKGGKQFTARRFGWSDVTQDDAQHNADARAAEALAKLTSGHTLDRREPKVPYNGASGVPIREEIVATHGETVITRNSYGALCLNTPDVLFADIDFGVRGSVRWVLTVGCTLVFCATLAAMIQSSVALAFGLVIGALILTGPVAAGLQRLWVLFNGGAERMAFRRIEQFVSKHSTWALRIYRTPAGLRTLAIHRTFDPAEPEVAEFFAAIHADPLYARMCLNQHCFRARVSAKPWRIGINAHMKPRPGIWPVSPDRMPERTRWIESYERAANKYAACQFVKAIGDGKVDDTADEVRALHDELCRATRNLPIA